MFYFDIPIQDRARRLRNVIARFERLLRDCVDPSLAKIYSAELAAAQAMLDEIERVVTKNQPDQPLSIRSLNNELATVYAVEDDHPSRKWMAALLQSAGYRVQAFADGEAFLDAERDAVPSCLAIDMRLPGMSGIEVLGRLSADGKSLPAIVLTAYGNVALAVAAMKAGAVDFIEKPVRPQVLLDAIASALQSQQNTRPSIPPRRC